MKMFEVKEWYHLNHLKDTGINQMALDEALLQWLQRFISIPVVIVRTYQWNFPTISLGIHQKNQHALEAYRFYTANQSVDVVIRPTGGRAILHGDDVSFAFVTNIPKMLLATLDESYEFFNSWVYQAIKKSGVPLKKTVVGDRRNYIRSSLCFETKIPSDLVAENGTKIAGSAQLRRQGGILQHGAAFIKPFNIKPDTFDNNLRETITNALGCSPINLNPYHSADLLNLWQTLQNFYAIEAEQILTKFATTSGSHFAPASS